MAYIYPLLYYLTNHYTKLSNSTTIEACIPLPMYKATLRTLSIFRPNPRISTPGPDERAASKLNAFLKVLSTRVEAA
jgi:hypothetical protein